MKLIHVIPEGENYFPMYSIEILAKSNPLNETVRAWTQCDLTHSKWSARLSHFETMLRHWRTHHIRVRVL